MPEEVAVTDPLGKTIFLLPAIFFAKNEAEEIYDDATAVIERPAMLVEVKESTTTQFYYFRSVGWKKTLLIVASWNINRWEAHDCIKNPSSTFLSELLKKGKQLI